jgi:hypothetical protein
VSGEGEHLPAQALEDVAADLKGQHQQSVRTVDRLQHVRLCSSCWLESARRGQMMPHSTGCFGPACCVVLLLVRGWALQEVASVELERDDLLKKMAQLEDIFTDYQRRFSLLLHVLAHDLGMPEDVLVGLTDTDVECFEHCLEEVRSPCSTALRPPCCPLHVFCWCTLAPHLSCAEVRCSCSGAV